MAFIDRRMFHLFLVRPAMTRKPAPPQVLDSANLLSKKTKTPKKDASKADASGTNIKTKSKKKDKKASLVVAPADSETLVKIEGKKPAHVSDPSDLDFWLSTTNGQVPAKDVSPAPGSNSNGKDSTDKEKKKNKKIDKEVPKTEEINEDSKKKKVASKKTKKEKKIPKDHEVDDIDEAPAPAPAPVPWNLLAEDKYLRMVIQINFNRY